MRIGRKERRSRSIISLLMVLCMAAALLPTFVFAAEEDTATGEPAQLMTPPGKNNAYVLFGGDVEENYMEFIDGMEQGITDSMHPLYSEHFEMNGIKARKVYKENYVYCKIDPSFYQPGDRNFIAMITFYDFGPDKGYYHLEYNSTDVDYKRISVEKPGLVPKWTNTVLLINDADFKGAMEYGADVRLVSNAYNGFAKLEFINIDAAVRAGGSDATLELIGTVNSTQADALHEIGFYDSVIEDGWDAGLEQTMTRREMVAEMLQAVGQLNNAKKHVNTGVFTDVSGEDAGIIDYAREIGIISGNGSGLFRPDDNATPRELLTMYMRYLKYDDENLYDVAFETGEERGFFTASNLILYPDIALRRDNFVAVAFNALGLQNQETMETPVVTMVKNGSVSPEKLRGTGNPQMMAQSYAIPTYMPKKAMTDSESNKIYYWMSIGEEQAIQPYVTSQKWDSTGSKFIVGSDALGAMFEYNVDTEMLTFLDFCDCSSSLYAFVTENDVIFYTKNNCRDFWRMDWNNPSDRKKIAELPPHGSGGGVLNATHDGRYISSYYSATNVPDYVPEEPTERMIPLSTEGLTPEEFWQGRTRFFRLDTETGEFDDWTISAKWDKTLWPDSSGGGHPIINPVYGNLLFFCHEGTTTGIPDRIWLGDFDTGKSFNLFEQAWNKELSVTGETSGHEVWAQDGEDLFFVKYWFAQNLGQSGVARVSKDGTEREYFGDGMNLCNWAWHCYPTGDKKWVVNDLRDRSSSQSGGLAITSTETYESTLLARFKAINPNHPHQPHPIVSYNGRHVGWQMIDPEQNNLLGVAWMDITPWTGSEVENKGGEINENLNLVSYGGASSDVFKESTEKRGEYWRIPMENTFHVDINDEFLKTKSGTIKLEITYLDKGRMPLKIGYTSEIVDNTDLANREDMEIRIDKHNTNVWLTKTVEIPRASINNSCKYMTDFYIAGMMSEAYVKDVKLVQE